MGYNSSIDNNDNKNNKMASGFPTNNDFNNIIMTPDLQQFMSKISLGNDSNDGNNPFDRKSSGPNYPFDRKTSGPNYPFDRKTSEINFAFDRKASGNNCPFDRKSSLQNTPPPMLNFNNHNMYNNYPQYNNFDSSSRSSSLRDENQQMKDEFLRKTSFPNVYSVDPVGDSGNKISNENNSSNTVRLVLDNVPLEKVAVIEAYLASDKLI